MKNRKTPGPIGRFLKRLGYGLNGIVGTFKTEKNFKIQTVAAIAAVILALVLRFPLIQLLLVVFLCFIVLILEMINTAIEVMLDAVSLKRRKDFEFIKDVTAGAVLMSAIMSVIVGLALYLPPLLSIAAKLPWF